jgi:4,5-DOPA dioxygenase extradiol
MMNGTQALYPLDRHYLTAVPRSLSQPLWQPGDGPLPALYLGHGAPPTLDDEAWMGQLFEWAMSMPKPKGIAIVSAHWENAPTTISSTGISTELVYDFGGFEQRFYEMRYDTPDASGLAHQIRGLMPDDEPLFEHPSRGLDHGAWVPLKIMYPLADVPVLQVSMPTHQPDRLLDLGRRLRELRNEGVLIIGSGFMTHGLPFLTREVFMGLVEAPSWSRDFDTWAAEALARGDVDSLANYRSLAPGLPFAHPTVEHYTPLFVTLGAAFEPERPVTTAIDGFVFGLSKRSFQVA